MRHNKPIFALKVKAIMDEIKMQSCTHLHFIDCMNIISRIQTYLPVVGIMSHFQTLCLSLPPLPLLLMTLFLKPQHLCRAQELKLCWR